MKQFKILSSESTFRYDMSGEKCLMSDVQAFYHDDYRPGGYWKMSGTIENSICTLKNDIAPYTSSVLGDASNHLAQILKTDLPEILVATNKSTLRVCVIPRAKKESYYQENQLYLRATIQSVVNTLNGFEDGTHDIIRHTNTQTTHRARWGYGGDGRMPYAGITRDTCNLSDNIIGKDILLIDDLYTKTVNIDEDCLQAIIEKGARSVIFYAFGKTINRF